MNQDYITFPPDIHSSSRKAVLMFITFLKNLIIGNNWKSMQNLHKMALVNLVECAAP